MAVCQAMTAVLPPTAHKRVLFFWCPHLQKKKNVHTNPEPPLYVVSFVLLVFQTNLSKILQFPKVSDDWLWHIRNPTNKMVVDTGLKTTLLSGFWLSFSFPNMLGSARTVYKLPMHSCYVCKYRTGLHMLEAPWLL
jgi:hypothetical protein